MPSKPQPSNLAQLPGKVSMKKVRRSDEGEAAVMVAALPAEADGPDEVELIYQEGYGFWPVCTNKSCHEQVEPTSYSMHMLAHDPEAVR